MPAVLQYGYKSALQCLENEQEYPRAKVGTNHCEQGQQGPQVEDTFLLLRHLACIQLHATKSSDAM
jgi:hypothetical protein